VLLRIFVILVLAAAIVGGAWFTVHELYIGPEERLKADRSLPPPAPPPDPSLEDFEKCMAIRNSRPQEVRKAFEQFLREYPSSTKRDAANDILGEVNSAEFFSTKPDASNTYVVKPGDALSRVATRNKISVELLVHLNHIDSRYLHPNQRLLVPACSFRMVIQQKARRVVLYDGTKFFRQYPFAAWPGGDRKDAIRPKQAGRVTEKRAFDEKGIAVPPAHIAYRDASHLILVSIPGRSLHTQPDDPNAIVQRPPGGGIGMAPKDIGEISILLPVGAPVSME